MSEGESGSGTSDEEILKAIRNHFAPAVGTADIAARAGVTRQAADSRLRNLLDQNLVESTKVGRSRIWWLTTDGGRYLDKEY